VKFGLNSLGGGICDELTDGMADMLADGQASGGNIGGPSM